MRWSEDRNPDTPCGVLGVPVTNAAPLIVRVSIGVGVGVEEEEEEEEEEKEKEEEDEEDEDSSVVRVV